MEKLYKIRLLIIGKTKCAKKNGYGFPFLAEKK